MADLEALRRELNRRAEPSNHEQETARFLTEFLADTGPDLLLTGLGGHGLAAVFEGAGPGPCVVLRAELDAVPAPGEGAAGAAHRCGHDGHLATVAGLAPWLAGRRPARGRVALLFQPAEETGEGAGRVAADPRYQALDPAYLFALHNLPGHPLGQVVVRPGPFACASRGLAARLVGAQAHAAHPEQAVSPGPALCRLIAGLPELARDAGGFALVTVVHARLGDPGFGTAPGEAEVHATLRAEADPVLEAVAARAVRHLEDEAKAGGLALEVTWHDPFAATLNHPEAVAAVARAARRCGLDLQAPPAPFRWSEDFGRLTAGRRGALAGLGAGEQHPALHARDYDFPDTLLAPGRRLLQALVEDLLG